MESGNVGEATLTLTNSIIGVTVLAMPYCFYQCGFLLGTALLLFVSFTTFKSCDMLLKSAMATKKRSYEFLAHHSYGPWGKMLVELSMMGLSVGTLIAFFVIIGDLTPQVLANFLALDSVSPTFRFFVMFVFAGAVILPLSLFRDLSSLSKLSAVSLCFYVVFVLHLIYLSFSILMTNQEADEKRKPLLKNADTDYVWFRPVGLLYSVPIVALAFSCQTQLFLLYESLSEPTVKVMHLVLYISVISSAAVYIVVGSLGYLAFHKSNPVLHGDLLTMYPSTFLSDIMKLGFVMSVAISFPIIAFPCRVAIFSFVYLRRGATTGDLTSESLFIPDPQFRAITTVVVFGTFIGGLLVPNVEFVLGLTGAITGSTICYIFPAGIYLHNFRAGSSRIAAYGVLAVGIFTLVVSTIALLDQPESVTSVARVEKVLAVPSQKHELINKQIKMLNDITYKDKNILVTTTTRIPRRRKRKKMKKNDILEVDDLKKQIMKTSHKDLDLDSKNTSKRSIKLFNTAAGLNLTKDTAKVNINVSTASAKGEPDQRQLLKQLLSKQEEQALNLQHVEKELKELKQKQVDKDAEKTTTVPPTSLLHNRKSGLPTAASNHSNTLIAYKPV